MPEPVFDRAGSDASAAMRALVQELFPIFRSITGKFREAAEMARVLEEHGLLQASTTGGQ